MQEFEDSLPFPSLPFPSLLFPSDAQIDVETSFHFLHVALLAIMWVAEVLRAILGDRS